MSGGVILAAFPCEGAKRSLLVDAEGISIGLAADGATRATVDSGALSSPHFGI